MTLTPDQAANKRILLSEEYSRLSDEMALLEQKEALYFHAQREEFTSDKAVQRAWDAGEEGQRLIYLKRHCKGLEKEISGLNSFITVATNQSRNYY